MYISFSNYIGLSGKYDIQIKHKLVKKTLTILTFNYFKSKNYERNENQKILPNRFYPLNFMSR